MSVSTKRQSKQRTRSAYNPSDLPRLSNVPKHWEQVKCTQRRNGAKENGILLSLGGFAASREIIVGVDL